MNLADEPQHIDPTVEPGQLCRSSTKRMVAGVAGGIAERFDVDANIVRVVFVVLTFLWGLGAAIYLAMWALIPKMGEQTDGAEPAALNLAQSVQPGWMMGTLLMGALVIGLIFSSTLWGGPRWGGVFGGTWLVFLVVLGVICVVRTTKLRSLRRTLAITTLVMMSLVIVAAGAFFGLVALTGVPMAGGIGDRVWQPTSLAQVQKVYRTNMGSMTIDLLNVPFQDNTVYLTATVAVGQLIVEVPPGVTVDVSAHSGIGDVQYGPQGERAFNAAARSRTEKTGTPKTGTPQSKLVLDAAAGIGQVQLVRGSPNGS